MNECQARLECLRLALSIAPSVSGESLIRLAEPMAQWVMRGPDPTWQADPDTRAPALPLCVPTCSRSRPDTPNRTEGGPAAPKGSEGGPAAPTCPP